MFADMKEKTRFYIGIDPDKDKSGFAVVDREAGKVTEAAAMTYAELLEELLAWRGRRDMVTVVVEASWLLRSNWHIASRYGSTARAAAIGHSVGVNHGVGMCIVQAAAALGLKTEERLPLAKFGHGRDGKLTQEDVTYYIKGLPPRTNQEVRDAARLAWVAAGLPERVRV